ncbi:MAG: hypothetical protein IPM78_00885 [Moraxellaceae bacterium]|nr:hypothetical protein [Moraxellaceae bacterium]
MTTLPFSRKALSIAILTTLLAACGGGSSDSGTSINTCRYRRHHYWYG